LPPAAIWLNTFSSFVACCCAELRIALARLPELRDVARLTIVRDDLDVVAGERCAG
jgi:hypothetical protein